MDRSKIKAQQTYKTEGGLLLYVQAIEGQRVIYCHVGQIVRQECSLGRFASRIASIEPNQ
jgi:hypothetical protein